MSDQAVTTKESSARPRRSSVERCPGDRKLAIINLFAVLLPVLGLAGAIVLLWGVAFNWWYLLLFGGMSIVSAAGITVGYHRLCTHKSFTTSAVLRYLFAAAGSMAVQGPVIRWCAEHRKHHQHSDTEDDPHSPHMSRHGSWGEGVMGTLRGAFHAHVGWLFAGHTKALGKYSADLRADLALALADRQFVYWVIAGLVVPALLAGFISMSWWGVLLGFLWGGLVRVLLVHHITWSVNSVCHLWGTKPFDSHDESRNNAVVALLAMGEGWHNNHHAFPTSARHGLRWWEFDFSYCLIRLLAMVGLARNVRVPSRERVQSRRLRKGSIASAVDSAFGPVDEHAPLDQGCVRRMQEG
jgi:stearoyl-CoA desaturase (delta-9 desaturase)